MNYKKLQGTDLTLSSLCLGTVNFGEKLTKEQSFELLDMFVRQGGNFIDTANVYCRWVPGLYNCGEKIIGEWLKSRGAYRNVVVATKGAHYSMEDPYRTSRVNETEIRKDLEDSLRTLGLEQIDFYWLHRDDPARPVEEIMDIMEKLKSEGKIRYYGLSNYRTDRLKQAHDYLKKQGLNGPYAVSNQWSLAAANPRKNTNQDPTMVTFSDEEYEWHKETKVPIIPFTSTALGFFEKLKKAGVRAENGHLISEGNPDMIPASVRAVYWNEENLKTYERLLKLQEETGHSLQALSVAFFFAQPFQAIPIGGARNPEQLAGFLEASEIDLPLEQFGR